jgi:hypothetical protein
MKYGGQTAVALRRQSLDRNRQYWQLLRSNVDCFICLQRKPEHVMGCGHGICDPCVTIRGFSQPTRGKEYHYDVANCPQCGTDISFQARIVPPTCGIRFLAIDGGGSRGIVSLGFMEELRQALGLRYAVQENFDYCIGTSSGESTIRHGAFELMNPRRYCDHRALWQALDPKEMHYLFPEVCEEHFPVQSQFQSLNLRYNQATLCILL